jgi:hypothetical protein
LQSVQKISIRHGDAALGRNASDGTHAELLDAAGQALEALARRLQLFVVSGP